MVCSEELPAQWQALPLSTRQEIQAGRNAIGADEVKRVTIARWADEGEKWLNEKFEDKGLMFTTSWDVVAKTITLQVFRENPLSHRADLLFYETCKAESFVTELMVTKILMIM